MTRLLSPWDAAASAAAGTAPPLPDTREIRVAHAQATLRVLLDGEGPLVVLLPSSLRDSVDFTPLALRLAGAGYLVARPQPRGMAGSTGVLDPLTLDDLALDVATVIRTLDPRGAVVAGHAYGHFVARVLDLRHPELVRGVVLLACAARSMPAELSRSLDLASDPSQDRAARLRALEHAFFAPGNPADAWLQGWYPELRAAYRQAAKVPEKDTWWSQARAPLLDIQGELDPWRPPASRRELQEQFGGKVSICCIANASHALIPEQPDAVAGAMLPWMAGLPPLSQETLA